MMLFLCVKLDSETGWPVTRNEYFTVLQLVFLHHILSQYPFNLCSVAGAGTREAELMAALKVLLDRLNTGNIPLSKESWEKLQREPPAGSSSSSVNIFHSGGSGAQVRTLVCCQLP